MKINKFRSWDVGDGIHRDEGNMSYNANHSSDATDIMQFIGFQDMHNVDIYERDLVNICYTSSSGEHLHDCIYEATINKLSGLTFIFRRLLWINVGHNQYPLSSVLNSGNLLGSVFNSGSREFLYTSDQYETHIECYRDFPFNKEKELAFHSRYFKVLGNIYQNPELLGE